MHDAGAHDYIGNISGFETLVNGSSIVGSAGPNRSIGLIYSAFFAASVLVVAAAPNAPVKACGRAPRFCGMRIHPSDNLSRLNVSTDWQRIGDGLETRPVPRSECSMTTPVDRRQFPRNYGSRRWSSALGPVLLPQDRLRDALPTTVDWA